MHKGVPDPLVSSDEERGVMIVPGNQFLRTHRDPSLQEDVSLDGLLSGFGCKARYKNTNTVPHGFAILDRFRVHCPNGKAMSLGDDHTLISSIMRALSLSLRF
jgi:hypothetical protein